MVQSFRGLRKFYRLSLPLVTGTQDILAPSRQVQNHYSLPLRLASWREIIRLWLAALAR
jgi:hypothetical protein